METWGFGWGDTYILEKKERKRENKKREKEKKEKKRENKRKEEREKIRKSENRKRQENTSENKRKQVNTSENKRKQVKVSGLKALNQYTLDWRRATVQVLGFLLKRNW